jgi:uncharacterized RDD family membrane protein YckC
MQPSKKTSSDDTTHLGPRQVFHSAEHVALEVPIAGPTSRILAYAIDSFCVGLILVGIVVAVLLATPVLESIQDYARGFAEQIQQSDSPERQGQLVLYFFALLLVAQFAVEWLYFVVLELVTGGRSIGKAIVGLRVCLDGGRPITPSATIMRNLLRIVDVLPVYYLTGLASMIVSREGKRLGDHAAGTIVVRLDRPTPAPPLLLADDDDADFRFERTHLAALGAEERALLRQTLRRAETLAPEQRREAIERAAEVLRQRLDYRPLAPEEAERFLKALFRTSRGR